MNAREVVRKTLLICIIQGGFLLLPSHSTTTFKNATGTATKDGITLQSNKGAAEHFRYAAPIRRHQSNNERAAKEVNELPPNEFDGRSAYINNRYVEDDNDDDVYHPPTAAATTSYNHTLSALPPPLYQFLQAQMEHILATSLPEQYQLQDSREALSVGGGGTLEHDMTVNGYDDVSSAIQLLSNTYVKGQQNNAGNSFHVMMPTTTETLELPQPIHIGDVTNKTVAAYPAHSTQSQHNNQSQVQSDLGFGYGTHPKFDVVLEEEQQLPAQNTIHTSVHRNSSTLLHMRKQRISFKTISTSSQIISTPLADLLFKYSIGIAKPTMGAGGNSLYEDLPLQNVLATVAASDKMNKPTKQRQSTTLGYAGGKASYNN